MDLNEREWEGDAAHVVDVGSSTKGTPEDHSFDNNI